MAAFKINQADLSFVLQQIKIAEAHAAGIPLTSILLDENGQVVADPEALNGQGLTYYVLDGVNGLVPRDASQPLAIPDPHVPFGLRTVDGTYNNIIPGRETWGAADQSMPRLLDPKYTSGIGSADLNGPGPGGVVVGGDYENPGNIVDTAPRTVSNLIVDMSLNNPAAIIAALTFAGSENVLADQAEISAAYALLKQARDTNDNSGFTPPPPLTDEPQPVFPQPIFDGNTLVDDAYYSARYGDVAASGIDPDEHYAVFGWREGRDPNAYFSTNYYLMSNPDVDAAGVNPLQHYMEFGWREGRDPSSLFDISYYLAANPDVDTANIDPLQHYLEFGRFEVRRLFETDFLVDDNYYNARYGDVAAAGIDPDEHYALFGWREGRNPNAYFSTDYYLLSNPDVDAAGINPLQHYLQFGWREGRDPSSLFDISEYLAANPDVDAANIDPLQHYLEFGRFEGRPIFPLIPNLEAALDAVLEAKGVTVNNGSIDIPNVAPDEGLSAPFNAWMTFFGQFFDHGLDLISKGGDGVGTVFVPLAPDDPLVTHGPDGIANNGDEVPPQLRFMTLTRATPTEDGSQTNTTTPFVDQNQTYTSHASHQVFLREYRMTDEGPVSTGRLLNGADGGLATWADVKAQAVTMLGIELTDGDVLNIPMILTDPYGEFVRGDNGLPQLVQLNSDGSLNSLIEGDLGAPVNTFTALAARIGHAFLDDIAHNANPLNSQTGALKIADDNTNLGLADSVSTAGRYDNELLDRHYITGDGRGNENIGLTAVHHIFHSEHNRQVDAQKLTILQSGNLAFVNEWLSVDIDAATLTAFNDGYDAAANKGAYLTGNALFNDGNWDGERLFQGARFATEMQYQHLVFEEFARKVQPNIDVFVFNSITDVDPSIFSEFANTVYRFGHSMLTENMPRIDADGNPMDAGLGLVEAFLNPVLFDQTLAGVSISHDEAAAAIVRGMTIERGNEIDEFVVDALRNNLLGLPLDLAAINIARGRDTGMPSLNDARGQLYAASGSSFLKPYDHWADFAANLKNPASIVNFIAAYGTHDTITAATTLEAKRDAAMALVFGGAGAPADRAQFLSGTGAWAGVETGLNLVDLWIGGLAEKKMPFGGFLGSTFNAVFELQLENLQDGDRFYYLTRTQGQNMLNALEQNSFAKMIMANTALADVGPDGIRGTPDDIVLRHIGVDAFATYDYVLEVNVANQADYDPDNLSATGKDPTGNDPFLEAIGLGKVVRVDPTGEVTENYLRVFGGEHNVIGGTNGNDTIIADFGDDGIWGDAGDDRIEAGAGVDLVNGGAGNDIITDSGDTGDFLKGDEGDDVIANSNGLDILMGGTGKDVFFVGVDATEVFAGEGDDFILGGDDVDFLLGNEGDDWMEGGGGFDTTAGDNSELFFNSAIKGHDVMFAGSDEHDFDAESGDDIMVQGESVIRNEGMFGFDWSIYKDVPFGADADLRVPIFTTEQADILRNRFDKVEALSGWDHDDILRGDDRVRNTDGATTIGTAEGVFFQDELTQAGVDRIDGLRTLLGNLIDAPIGATAEERELEIAFDGGNILLGGGGNDLLQGNGGDDFLDGDAWLNVRIRITGDGEANQAANEISTVDSLRHTFSAEDVDTEANPETAEWIGKSLFELMISRAIAPNQMHIVREILDGGGDGDEDVAAFNDIRANYTITLRADGGLTVFHHTVTPDTVLVSDGTDTLINTEVLRFTDGDLLVSDIQAQPFQVLTIVHDGAGVLRALHEATAEITGYLWEALEEDGVWQVVGTDAATYAPAAAIVGQEIRVSALYEGGAVLSRNTAIVGDGNENEIDGSDTSNLIVGLAGDDRLQGELGNDVIEGGEGNDRLDGGDGDDELLAGAGDDLLNGRDGNDILRGGAGDDELSGGHGDDQLFGGDGNDTAVFEIDIDSYRLERQGTDVVVTDERGAEGDGTDSVNGVELFSFGAATFALADAGTAGDDLLVGTQGLDNLSGAGGDDTMFGGAGDDTLEGAGGNDLIFAGGGDDTINWGITSNLGFEVANDGRDFVDGGAGTLDRFVVNGGASAETFIVYAASDALAAGFSGFKPGTEIVITRNGAVIAELDNIEEITINTGAGNDSVTAVGNFNPTSLSFNTITINGDGGNDTVDVSTLQSAHRILFRCNGGNDTIVGNLRPQDVIELAAGQDVSTYSLVDNGNGTQSFTNGAHSITFTGSVPPQFQNTLDTDGDDDVSDDDDDDDGTVSDDDDDGTLVEDDDDTDDDDTVDDDDGQSLPPVPPVVAGLVLTGTVAADAMMGSAEADAFNGGEGDDIILGGDGGDTLMGGSGSDLVKGDAGSDMIFGGADGDVLLGGGEADMIFGDDGNDRLFGDDGADMLEGGAGSDTAYGGAGDDRLIARQGDGDDILWGESGQDTLDYAAITASLTVDLGNGTMQHGSVLSSQSGYDAIFGFENVIGGAGDDQIFASSVANVLDGGGGNDVFVFRTAADADGDRIDGFSHGDKIDLTGIGGDQAFSLQTTALTGAGQVSVTHVIDDGEAVTRIQGNVSGGPGADFTLDVAGTHNLTSSDFDGVA